MNIKKLANFLSEYKKKEVKTLWLFGENTGKTANNNSFYCWLNFLRRNDGIDKYFIVEKDSEAALEINKLPESARRMIVWRNSLEHIALYNKADMGFATLSYLDVVPDSFAGKQKKWYAQFPIVYLQHGVLGQKKIGYTKHSYNNNLFRFIYYNRHIKKHLIEENGILPYQLHYGQYLPRYQELVKRSRAHLVNKCSSPELSILWFLTWREYKKNSIEEIKFKSAVANALTDPRLGQYLDSNNARLTVVLHRQMMSKNLIELSFDENKRINLLNGGNIDILDWLASADLLITDYSSVAYDFAFLNKPVILFTPDRIDYQNGRSFYSNDRDYNGFRFDAFSDVLECLEQKQYGVPPFFRNAFPEAIDYDAVSAGEHIDRLYDYFSRVQRNSISFVGYNFWGAGGTVSATKSLAEALAVKGYAVNLVSLKGKLKAPAGPCGVRYRFFYREQTKSRLEKAKRLLFRRKKYFSSIRYDESLDNLIPYSGYALERYFDTCNSAVVVSTRDSFHSALLKSSYKGKKFFFWHTAASCLDDVFSGIVEDLKCQKFQNSLFTTDQNMQEIQALGIDTSPSLSIGNTLLMKDILPREEAVELRNRRYFDRRSFYADSPIASKSNPDCLNCVTLLRFSEDRRPVINNIIKFGKRVRSENAAIKLFVYGGGALLEYFIDTVYKESLAHQIEIMGPTTTPAEAQRCFDIMIDFADHQSFGMATLECVMNGCLPLCSHNAGSAAILGDQPQCFYESMDALLKKATWNYASDTNLFLSIYDKVVEEYSPQALAERFVDFCKLEHIDPK